MFQQDRENSQTNSSPSAEPSKQSPGLVRVRSDDFQPIPEYVAAYRRIVEIINKYFVFDQKQAEEEQRNLNSKFKNCCGQYAIVAVLRAQGIEIELSDVISQTNPLRLGTGTVEIMDFLRSKNLVVSAHNQGPFRAIAEAITSRSSIKNSEIRIAENSRTEFTNFLCQLDERGQLQRIPGRMAIALVNASYDTDPPEFAPHWVAIQFSHCDTAGNPVFRISDAANMSKSQDGSFVGLISLDEFDKAWERPFARVNEITPYKRYWIGISPQQNTDNKSPIKSQLKRLVPTSPSTFVPDHIAHAMEKIYEGPAKLLAAQKAIRSEVERELNVLMGIKPGHAHVATPVAPTNPTADPYRELKLPKPERTADRGAKRD